MTTLNWDQYFLNLCHHISLKSKDPSTKVGCVIVGPDHEIRSTGFNGFPRGVNELDPSRWERPDKYKWVEHAERNAIYAAARIGVPLKGCTLYTNWGGYPPCIECSKGLVQAGIIEVVGDANNTWKFNSAHWSEEEDYARVTLHEAGVIVRDA
jgi:dCMP deaminase